MNQFATVIETYDYGVLNANTLETFTFNLANFPRASLVAPAYRWVKPVEVIWEYTPLYNVYQDQVTGTGTSLPSFFSIMNRTQDSRAPPNASDQLMFMESQGARPRQFTKKITLKYKPNWCSPGLIAVQQQNQQASSPPFPVITGVVSQGLKAETDWIQSLGRVDKSYLTVVPPGANPDAQGTLPVSGMNDANFAGGNPDFPSNIFAPQQVLTLTNTVTYNGHDVFVRQDNTGTDTQIADVRVIVKWAFKNPNGVNRVFGDRAVEVPTEV